MKNSKVAKLNKPASFTLPSRGSFSYLTPQKNSTKASHSDSELPPRLAIRYDTSPQRVINDLNDSKEQSTMLTWGLNPGESIYITEKELRYSTPPKQLYQREASKSPYRSGLSPNLIPKEEQQFRASRKLGPKFDSLQLFSKMQASCSPDKTPVKTEQKTSKDLSFTLSPRRQEDQNLKYHITSPQSVNNMPVCEPMIHKEVKETNDKMRPNCFDDEGKKPEVQFAGDDQCQNKAVKSNDSMGSFKKSTSVARQGSKKTPKKAERRLKNASMSGIEAILRHDYLYGDKESKPKKKNIKWVNEQSYSTAPARRMKKRVINLSMNLKQPSSLPVHDSETYFPDYYARRHNSPDTRKSPETDRLHSRQAFKANLGLTPR